MQRLSATIQNLSTFDRQHWAVVTFPKEKAKDFGVECTFVTRTGMSWRAVRGVTVGGKTTYRILTDIGGSEKVAGALINESISSLDTIPAFKPHKWVTDDIAALIPSLKEADEEFISLPKVIDSSPAHQRWHIKKKDLSRGLIFEWWADIFHDDPVVLCKGKIVWSDRTDPSPNRTFPQNTLSLSLGEFFVLDFASRKGMSPATQNYPVSNKSQWVSVLNDKNITLNDGAGLPLSLNMLCFTQDELDPNGDPEDITQEDVKGILNLQAGAIGGIASISHDWGSHWLSGDNVPRIGNEGLFELDMAMDLEKWEDSLQVNTGAFGDTLFGLGRTPGQTGNQDDFGATKGTYLISNRELKFVPAFQYAAYTELFRGVNHYELDATPLKVENHPNWTTWNCKTHSSGSDKLGKTSVAPPGTGWNGYDDQHRSQNSFAAYAMISDDPLIDDQIAHYLTTDRACYRVRHPNNSPGAARAQGRHLQAWSQMLGLSDDPKWKEIIDIRINAIANHPPLNIENEMKVLSFRGPDGRKLVYKNGELTSSTSMWEHGLAAVGLYNLYKQHATEDVRTTLTTVCETLLKFGYFKDRGVFYTVDDLAYTNGNAPSNGMNAANVWDRTGENPKTQEIVAHPYAGGTGDWTFAGILTAREFLNIQDNELDHYIDSHTGGMEADNRFHAEWWATVKNI